MTRSLFFISLISTLFFVSCESSIKHDYVGLEIPPELQDNPKAVAYLEKDAKQLNRFFNSLDEVATEFEDLAVLISQVDTTDQASIEAAKPGLRKKIDQLNRSVGKVTLNMFWYFGKDMLAGSDAPEEILRRLETDEGVAFEKSLNHIKLQKGLLKERAESFMKKIEDLDLPVAEE